MLYVGTSLSLSYCCFTVCHIVLLARVWILLWQVRWNQTVEKVKHLWHIRSEIISYLSRFGNRMVFTSSWSLTFTLIILWWVFLWKKWSLLQNNNYNLISSDENLLESIHRHTNKSDLFILDSFINVFNLIKKRFIIIYILFLLFPILHTFCRILSCIFFSQQYLNQCYFSIFVLFWVGFYFLYFHNLFLV